MGDEPWEGTLHDFMTLYPIRFKHHELRFLVLCLLKEIEKDCWIIGGYDEASIV